MIKQKQLSLLSNFILLLLFIATIILLSIKYGPEITHLVKKPDKFRALLTSYGPTGLLIFIFFQVVQVIVAPIPGEFLQIAGGYIYGTVFGTIYSLTGILLGTVLVFYISRILGFRLLKSIIPADSLTKFNFMINSPKSEIMLFLFFLIPGIPKDILTYIAGATPIKPLSFFIICTIARFPGIIASSFVGANIQEKDYLSVIIVSTIASILFIIGLIKKDFIVHHLHKLLHPKGDC